MPLFDFKCEQCHKLKENVLTEATETELRCECGGFLIKQFPHSNFQLKGGGWYKDSYNKPQKTNEKENPVRPHKSDN